MDHWLEPVFKAASEHAVLFGHGNDEAWAEHMEWPLAFCGFAAFAIGSGIAYFIYIKKQGEPARRAAETFPALHQLLLDKWRVDELYESTVIAAVDSLADTSAVVDRVIVDGVLARLTSMIVAASGTVLRALQTGVVHVYAATMVVGIALMAWFFAAPHANYTLVETGSDDYVVTAAPGVGYGYRWDSDGDGTPDKPNFGSDSTLKLHVNAGKDVTVNLEVKNAFGLVKKTSIHVARPNAPVSQL
jgi:NADH-quinone oxidoreductase subunit L